MAYIKQIQMIIGTPNQQGEIKDGIDISNLDLTFNITRSITLDNNAGEFEIYNMKKETRDKLLKDGNVVIFKAGYEDEKNISTIHIGRITKVEIKNDIVNHISRISTLDIGSNKEGLEYKTYSVSYKAKSQLKQIITDLADEMGIPISGEENAAGITLNNGLVHAGSIGALLRRLKKELDEHDIGFYFDNSEMILYKIGQKDSRFGSVYLTKDSGLLGEVENIENKDKDDGKKRIKFTSLLNHKLKPNAVVTIKSENYNSSYIVEKVEHSGDNMAGGFTSVCEAVV